MKAAIYARYSSENQRPESIDDQISSCKKLAAQDGHVIADEYIFTDAAASGARKDRSGLGALLEESENGGFEVVLVDDLSRLARDNHLMLTVMAELRFNGVRVISVADGLDSADEEATVGIQIRGIFNELQLRDLRKKTLRGQMGQKERGFFVGERTFGYKSVPVGEVRMDKKGRPRPEGYKMVIEPREAATVLRIFQEFAAGKSQSHIVRELNAEGVPGRFRSAKGWSPATVYRILQNTKYDGRWAWNMSETRRDPKTGRRRQFPKPESEWIIKEDESLRIVPTELWKQVQERLKEVRKTWPGGKGKRGFQGQQGGRTKQYPTHLLSGGMVCGSCGAAIAQVSGKSGGYYGCLAASKSACDNRMLVRRTLAERIILAAVRDQLDSPENLQYLFKRVEEVVKKQFSSLPETIHLKQAELESEERRVVNFVEFIAEGRGSTALAKALAESERKTEILQNEVDVMNNTRDKVFKTPPLPWIKEKVATLQGVLEKRTGPSALLLRKLLGTVRLTPTQGEVGKPYYLAKSNLQPLVLLEEAAGDGGSNTLHWWRRRESNPCPETFNQNVYRHSRRLKSRSALSHRRETDRTSPIKSRRRSPGRGTFGQSV